MSVKRALSSIYLFSSQEGKEGEQAEMLEAGCWISLGGKARNNDGDEWGLCCKRDRWRVCESQFREL